MARASRSPLHCETPNRTHLDFEHRKFERTAPAAALIMAADSIAGDIQRLLEGVATYALAADSRKSALAPTSAFVAVDCLTTEMERIAGMVLGQRTAAIPFADTKSGQPAVGPFPAIPLSAPSRSV